MTARPTAARLDVDELAESLIASGGVVELIEARALARVAPAWLLVTMWPGARRRRERGKRGARLVRVERMAHA